MSEPVIILVRPQLVENIGMVARAMKNCALHQLRLVSPRDHWPLQQLQKERMEAAASGAEDIFANTRIFHTTADAVADMQTVYATTARPRDMVKEVITPRRAADEARTRIKAGEKIAFLFGPERTGLENEDLQCAEKIINIPANPDFSSINIAQAVLLMAYEWYTSGYEGPMCKMELGKTVPASKKELNSFFSRMESELEICGFYTNPDMKPAMQQNLRNAFLRASLTEQEIRTLQGVLTALADGPKRSRKVS